LAARLPTASGRAPLATAVSGTGKTWNHHCGGKGKGKYREGQRERDDPWPMQAVVIDNILFQSGNICHHKVVKGRV